MAKLRLDKLLLERQLVGSRTEAQGLILAGRVLVEGQKVDKPGSLVDSEAGLRLLGERMRYVSRGGLKLEAALDHWGIDLRGKTCLDIGASTGGFTDCMLQRGATRVIAVDTGYGQIDLRLRQDSRVRLLENTNARFLTAADLAAEIDFLALDVSFISATLVLPAAVVAVSTSSSGELETVVLVKPQFEVGRDHVGKRGIVFDSDAQQSAVDRVSASMRQLGFERLEAIESPLRGREGNREFLLHGVLAARPRP